MVQYILLFMDMHIIFMAHLGLIRSQCDQLRVVKLLEISIHYNYYPFLVYVDVRMKLIFLVGYILFIKYKYVLISLIIFFKE